MMLGESPASNCSALGDTGTARLRRGSGGRGVGHSSITRVCSSGLCTHHVSHHDREVFGVSSVDDSHYNYWSGWQARRKGILSLCGSLTAAAARLLMALTTIHPHVDTQSVCCSSIRATKYLRWKLPWWRVQPQGMRTAVVPREPLAAAVKPYHLHRGSLDQYHLIRAEASRPRRSTVGGHAS